MSRRKRITIWSSRANDRAPIEHNHIQYGWTSNSQPIPINEYQRRAWKGREWFKEFGYLVQGTVRRLH